MSASHYKLDNLTAFLDLNDLQIGGLGSAVAEVLIEECPVKMKRIGINDEFGRSGSDEILLEKYNLTAEHIVEIVKSF